MVERSHPLTRILAILGGMALIVAVVQFAVAQLIAAAAWNPPYSWSANVISDLGNTACGPFAVHGAKSYVCSPRYAVMNVSFVAAGLLLIVGMILFWRLWPARRMTTTALVLWLIAGLGKIVVGLVPENTNASLHTLGASNIFISGIAIVLLSLVARQPYPALAGTGLVLAIVSLAASVLWTAAQSGNSTLYLGLGTGGMERLADYPTDVWLALVGIQALVSTRVRTRHALQRSLPVGSMGTAGQ